MNEIRVGRISSVNYEKGAARVVYTDRQSAVSAELPFLASEYMMPEPGDLVFVLLLSSGTEAGLILGRAWNDKNRPYAGGKGLYRKELSRTKNDAYIQYDDSSGVLRIKGRETSIQGTDIPLKTSAHETSVEALLAAIADLQSDVEELRGIIAGLQ